MLLGIAGVTGVGKTYYKNLIAEALGFQKITTLTTRAPRADDKDGDKLYVSSEEIESLKIDGKIAYDMKVLGGHYAYRKEDLFSDGNHVFEVHYDNIFDLKRICPHLMCLYLFPKDLEVPKNRLRERNLTKEIEDLRLAEMDEHYARMGSDEELRAMFDQILYNNYDTNSDEAVIDFVKKTLERNTR